MFRRLIWLQACFPASRVWAASLCQGLDSCSPSLQLQVCSLVQTFSSLGGLTLVRVSLPA